MEKGIVNAVLETSNNILLEVYGDLLKPGVSQVGQAIGTLIGLGNTLLMPLALKNEKSKINIQNNLNIYRQKLETISEENIQSVVPEIGVPILEKLMYVSDETLVDLYTELLAKASDKEQCKSTHPSFVNIINNLSPKESKLLDVIDKNIKAVVDVNVVVGESRKPCEQISEFVLDDEYYDKNLTAYLSNLVGLGLIEINLTRHLQDSQRYELLETKIKDVYKKSPIQSDEYSVLFHMRNGDLEFTRGCINTTSFGELFLIACTKKSGKFEIYDAWYRYSEHT